MSSAKAGLTRFTRRYSATAPAATARSGSGALAGACA